MRLVLSRCTVRDWRRSDAASLARHADNPKIWRNVRDHFPHPYRLDHAERFIARALAQRPRMQFAIVVDGRAVGGIGLIPGTDIYRHTAEIGFWLGEELWGRGIMTEAARALTRFAFRARGLRRIQANVFEWNRRSMRVLRKAGYAREARLRQAVTKEGRTVDDIIYAVVRRKRPAARRRPANMPAAKPRLADMPAAKRRPARRTS
jgi:RimJ/RimL family protein N-acetyltransferase